MRGVSGVGVGRVDESVTVDGRATSQDSREEQRRARGRVPLGRRYDKQGGNIRSPREFITSSEPAANGVYGGGRSGLVSECRNLVMRLSW